MRATTLREKGKLYWLRGKYLFIAYRFVSGELGL